MGFKNRFVARQTALDVVCWSVHKEGDKMVFYIFWFYSSPQVG